MKTTKDLSIFLVDDDKMFLKSLEYHLQHRLKTNIKIKSFQTGEECLKNLDQKPNIIILDYMLNGNYPSAMDGIEVLKKVKEADPETAVIMISGQEKTAVAVETIKNGAYDYVLKNDNTLLKIQTAIKNAVESMKVSKELNISILVAKIFILIIALVALILTFKHAFS